MKNEPLWSPYLNSLYILSMIILKISYYNSAFHTKREETLSAESLLL